MDKALRMKGASYINNTSNDGVIASFAVKYKLTNLLGQLCKGFVFREIITSQWKTISVSSEGNVDMLQSTNEKHATLPQKQNDMATDQLFLPFN